MVPSQWIVIFEPTILISILGRDGRRKSKNDEYENQEEGVVPCNREASYELAT